MNAIDTPAQEREAIRAFLRERSERLFLALYRPHADVLYRLALHLCGQEADMAKDLVQETWIVAVRRLDRFEHRSSFRTWLTGILMNKWREQAHKETGTTALEEDAAVGDPIESPIETLDLRQAVDRLPNGYRAVLLLHDAEGYKHHEIAQILGISEGTSKSQLSHARAQMRKSLKGMP